MTIADGVEQRSATAAAKAERQRELAQAMRDYEAEKLAVLANMARLRDLRLRKEAEAKAATKAPAKKAARRVTPSRAGRPSGKAS